MSLTPPSPAPPLLPDTSGVSCTPLKQLPLPRHYTGCYCSCCYYWLLLLFSCYCCYCFCCLVSTPLAVEKLTKEMSARYRHGNNKESSIPLRSNRTCLAADRSHKSQDHTYSLSHTPLKYANQSKTRASEIRNANVIINSPLLTNTPLLTYDNRLLPPSHHTDTGSHHTDTRSPPVNHTDPGSHHTDTVSHHTDPRSPPVNHTDPGSHHTDPRSPPVNHTDPISPHVNHTDPVSTPFTNITNHSSDSLANKVAII